MRERIIALVGRATTAARSRWGPSTRSAPGSSRRDGAAIGLSPRFVIYDTDDQQSPDEAGLPATLTSRSRAASSGRGGARGDQPGQEQPRVGRGPGRGRDDPLRARDRPIATRYSERLRAAGALDFDDLLCETVRLLETQPEVLAALPGALRYVLVDEYQDTNRAQYLCSRSWPRRHKNICVVGDDDQSIYAWRGADVRNILDFEERVPRREGGEAGAELPLHLADPRRRQRGHRLQRGAQGERSSGPSGPAVDRSIASRPTTRRRRRSGSPARSKRCSAGGAAR